MSQRDPDPMAVLATLTIRQHQNGALSIEGPVADTRWCLSVLDNARDSIKARIKRDDDGLIVTPAHDVSIA